MMYYQVGEIAYMLESGRYIREGKIVGKKGEYYLLRFVEGGGTLVARSRLFPTEEAVQRELDRRRSADPGKAVLVFR